MFSPVARITDMHVCPMQTPAVVPIPHVGGPIIGPGAVTVMAGGMPVSVVGDLAICVGPPDIMVMGSPTVFAMGMPIVRITDMTAHLGMPIVGLPTVMVGDSGGVGSPQAATMSAAKAAAAPFVRSNCNAKAAEAVAAGGAARAAASPGAAASSALVSSTVASSSGPSPSPGAEPASQKTTWVEIEVVDADGKPLRYQKVRVTDAAGTPHVAYSDASGIVRIEGMAAGSCKITMPDLDQSSWESR